MSSRIRNHVLEERSIAFLRDAFPDSWVIHPFSRDYGIDIQVEVFAENGDRTGIRFYGQVKATDRDEDDDLLRLDRSHFEYWAAHTDPVALLRYFDQSKQLRWCWMHDVDWLMKPETQSLDVAELLKTWDKNNSSIEVERYLHARRQALFESVTPPYEITVEQFGSADASPLLAANIAKAINSKSFRVLTKDLAVGVFHVVVATDKIVASHCGLPGFVFHHEDELTDSEVVERSLYATFLCACRYERVLFARALATSIAPLLYRAAGEKLRLTLFDAMIFALGLKPAAEFISPLIAEDENPLLSWFMFTTACAASSFKYGEAHSWDTLLRQWIKAPPIPENAGAFAYNLGNSLFNQGQWAEACEAFASALTNDPSYENRAYFWGEYGAANFEAGNLDVATRCYEKAIMLKDDPAARWRLGDTLFHLGHYDKAGEQFRTALPKLDSHTQGYVGLLLHVCDEIQRVWGLSSQALSTISEEDLEGLKTSAAQLNESDVILHLQPLMNMNAIDGFFNFNAGVFANHYGHHSIAAYRFLTCALRQRGDAEAWTNSIMCALNSGDIQLALLSAKAAHFCLDEQFLPWVLGSMPNSPKIPEPIAETWRSMMTELVESFERDRDAHHEAPVLRIHGPSGSKEFHWGSQNAG
jgi:tetratricopeptide (TPR) repeat protein